MNNVNNHPINQSGLSKDIPDKQQAPTYPSQASSQNLGLQEDTVFIRNTHTYTNNPSDHTNNLSNEGIFSSPHNTHTHNKRIIEQTPVEEFGELISDPALSSLPEIRSILPAIQDLADNGFPHALNALNQGLLEPAWRQERPQDQYTKSNTPAPTTLRPPPTPKTLDNTPAISTTSNRSLEGMIDLFGEQARRIEFGSEEAELIWREAFTEMKQAFPSHYNDFLKALETSDRSIVLLYEPLDDNINGLNGHGEAYPGGSYPGKFFIALNSNNLSYNPNSQQNSPTGTVINEVSELTWQLQEGTLNTYYEGQMSTWLRDRMYRLIEFEASRLNNDYATADWAAREQIRQQAINNIINNHPNTDFYRQMSADRTSVIEFYRRGRDTTPTAQEIQQILTQVNEDLTQMKDHTGRSIADIVTLDFRNGDIEPVFV